MPCHAICAVGAGRRDLLNTGHSSSQRARLEADVQLVREAVAAVVGDKGIPTGALLDEVNKRRAEMEAEMSMALISVHRLIS